MVSWQTHAEFFGLLYGDWRLGRLIYFEDEKRKQGVVRKNTATDNTERIGATHRATYLHWKR